jgi:ABC-2 type transport system ATP-binding protein
MMSAITATAVVPSVIESPRVLGAPAAVRLEGVRKRFVARRSWRELVRAPFRRTFVDALTDISCEVREGEFFGLLGPNGAGKTTLFKILATLITPDDGEVRIGEVDGVRDPNAVRRILVPVVADERSLRWRLDAYENLRLFAVLYRVPSSEMRARIQEVLEVVGLQDTGAKMVGQFSSGMRQRLLVARALLSRPSVLLLDEPTRGLDPLSARSLRTFLKDDLCRRQGCTILLATHNAEEAFHVCDRVAILDRGRLLTADSADRLAARFAEERYRIWTRMGDHAALSNAATLGLVTDVSVVRVEPDGWQVIEMRITGSDEGAARLLDVLVRSGMEVARLERVRVSLADLIERVQKATMEVHGA